MPKRAFLVVGPESSGNRITTECLIDAGCYGDAGHAQLVDYTFDYAVQHETIVVRRSMPHGDTFPDLHTLLKRMRENGFDDVRVIVITRDQFCTVMSMLHGRDCHTKTRADAELRIVNGMRRIEEFLQETRLPFYHLTYETLVHSPALFHRLLKEWGLDPSKIAREIKDGNAKWLGYKSEIYPTG